jgi:uncharacterized LabA/DUF88 family protein
MEDIMECLYAAYTASIKATGQKENIDDISAHVFCTKNLANFKDHVGDDFGTGNGNLKGFVKKFEWHVLDILKMSGNTGKNADVDTNIVDLASVEIATHPGEYAALHVASGDKDMLPTITRAKNEGMYVSIVAYKRSIAGILRRHATRVHEVD